MTLADAHAQYGDRDRAKELYRAAAAMKPDDLSLQKRIEDLQ